MKRFALLLPLLILCEPASAQLAAYWVPDAGCSLSFDIQGNELTVEAFEPLGYTQYAAGNWASFYFVLDLEADVCWSEYHWYDPSGDPNPQQQSYDPPVKVLDYPLTTGKTWQATTSEVRTGHFARPLTVTGTVVGPAVVATGLGDLDVIVVHIAYAYTDGYGGDWSKTYYLNDQFGHVLDLVSITGCDVVTAESTTWSTIKAMAE